jgi:hypothetical protein
MQLIMRSTAQPNVVDPCVAHLCPSLSVVELAQRAGAGAGRAQ